jgi:hypothetical protein
MGTWTNNPPPTPPPGPTSGDPPPTDPGWAPTVQKELDQAKKDRGNPPGSPWIRIDIKSGDTEVKYLDGDDPGEWERDANVTVTFQSPHEDYTRFKRKYPKISWAWYRKITVTITIWWGPSIPLWTDELTYWVLDPPIHHETDWWIYRWRLTSYERQFDTGSGTTTTGWTTDDTPPEKITSIPRPDDLHSPSDPFPPHMVPRPPSTGYTLPSPATEPAPTPTPLPPDGSKGEAPKSLLPTIPEPEEPKPKRVGMLAPGFEPHQDPLRWVNADLVEEAVRAATKKRPKA